MTGRSTAARSAACVLACLGLSACERPPPLEPIGAATVSATSWPEYGGRDAQHHADLDAITPANVGRLRMIWEYHTGDVADGRDPFRTTSAFELTPILEDDTLFLCTPFNRVIALDPGTGEERWAFDPGLDTSGNFSNQLVCRGVAFWRDPAAEESTACATRIFTATLDARLIALDAKTGQRCADFAEGADIVLAEGVGDSRWYGEYSHTSPPAIVGDRVVVGGAIGDNARLDPPSGVVRAYDVRTGELAWAFDLAPPGYVPRPEQLTEAGYVKGTPNVWAPISVDAERDLLFVPTGNPSPDYYRPDEAPLDHYGSAVVALRGSTGEVVWHYQFVHHDQWDFDTPAQPALVDLERDGERIPALVQATKMGFLFVLHRETGAPLLPVEERPVPQAHVPGNVVSATQPFPVRPPPLVPTQLEPDDAWGLTFWDRGQCRDAIASLRFEGMYTQATEQWTLMYPGNAGGSNWGGIAIDPDRQLAIANVMDLAWKVRLIPAADFDAYRRSHAGEVSPQRGTPFGMHREALLSPLGIPCNPPPWGKLVAVDLRSGEIRWEEPLGTTRDLMPIPIGRRLGVPGLGGPLVTRSGLVFIGAAVDDYLRAFDIETGEELWKGRLPAGGQATPMSYAVTSADGRTRQVVVIAAGGHGRAGTTLGDSLIAWALPDGDSER